MNQNKRYGLSKSQILHLYKQSPTTKTAVCGTAELVTELDKDQAYRAAKACRLCFPDGVGPRGKM